MCGLKSTRAALHAQLSGTLQIMDFKPSSVITSVWVWSASSPNSFKYYEYIKVRVYDNLVVPHVHNAKVRID